MALPKSTCDNCINTECLWRAPTGGLDPPVMVCPSKIEKPKTNADHIRAMTDEELAVICEDGCPPHHECPPTEQVKMALKNVCQGCWLEWLKEEAKEVEKEKDND